MNTHKYKQLSLEQRSQLQLLLKLGISKKEIAEELGVHRSTVYRELKRNAKKNVRLVPDMLKGFTKERTF
jgi:transposase, IS30 family